MQSQIKIGLKLALLALILTFLVNCGGTHIYKLESISENIATRKPLPGTVSLKVAAEPVYHHALGINKYELYVQEAVEKQFQHSLQNSFAGGFTEKQAETNLIVTAIDTSTFPISNVINDIRIFFRVEIFDREMQLQKTWTIYGFGSDPEGHRAMEKAVANAFWQLVPILEEMFIRQ